MHLNLRSENAHRCERRNQPRHRNDSPFYKPLLDATAKAGFRMQEVSADKGYISMKNLQATIDHGAMPSFRSKRIHSRIVAMMYAPRCSFLQLQAR
jgi:hypothetical protein